MFLFGSLAAIVVVGFSVAGAPLQAQAGIDRAALDALVDAARAANSDALVVLRDGEVVFESSFGQPIAPIESMSVTKSVVNLALGHLYTEGKITSLDQPVHHYFPEWKQGRKQAITLRHLLSHTSGLQNVRHTGVEIYPSPDFVRLALAAELSDAPGERFAYNNKALNLIPAITQQLTGKRIDDYLRDGLFKELGITRFTWSLDAAGNAHGMSGLQILPADLAKLGQLMLQKGRWEGRVLIREDWIDESLRPVHANGENAGLLWWRIQADARWAGYGGRGYLGQYLTVYPDQGLVAVRMIRSDRHANDPVNDFPAFEKSVRALLPQPDSENSNP